MNYYKIVSFVSMELKTAFSTLLTTEFSARSKIVFSFTTFCLLNLIVLVSNISRIVFSAFSPLYLAVEMELLNQGKNVIVESLR